MSATAPGGEQAPTCSDGSAAAGEALAGTASQTARWLVVEWRGAWGRDAIADTGLPEQVEAALTSFDGRALLVRRPDRRSSGEAVVFHAEATEEGGALRRLTVDGDVTERDVAQAETAAPLDGPLVLVCAHGRRDACCARHGPPVFDSLAPHVDASLLWQSSHQGGHRFAANVLALPFGVQLGRLSPADASRAAALLREGRIPLDLYRGRTLYEPWVQAAEIELRLRHGLDGMGDLRLLAADGDRVRFAAPDGELEARVETAPGPSVAPSCGDEPEPTVRYVVSA
jgi:hypothetical protein